VTATAKASESASLAVNGLAYELRRSPKRTTIGITVDRDGSLILSAPEDCPTQTITLLFTSGALERAAASSSLPTERASPRELPRRIQSRPTVVPIPARAKSKSRPVASGMLSETTRHHPTSMPRSDRHCEDEHEPHHYRPFFMPLSTKVRRRPLRAPVGAQLHYLTVHLV
jgi:hypothetical protein